ncbi:Mitochondrial oxaloacetate transport protein [Smittium culicis]|uniref:Mitochondrial oxaloacetate transport protein n=1 Tax=Smittium culicis TaxID=133412 RepID=A0A1R1XF47_9FUNG|nr:Mitochondrial oxaloacetate transport protein [Smittium culicis]OMJ20191.1 Mitochondrial oxaloacetate transport protein [Smittium culicis]
MSTPQPDSKAFSFFAAALASCGAVTVVKTRLQLQGELAKLDSSAPRPYKNVAQAFFLILRKEGPMALQKGLGCAYLYQVCLNGIRVGMYEPIKNGVSLALDTKNSKSPDTSLLMVSILSGSIAGILGAFAGSPFYLVKTRLQSSSSFASVGTQHNYNGIVDAFKSIYGENKVRGLYQGVSAACLRVGIGSPVQLVSYDYCKQYFSKLFNERSMRKGISNPDNSFKTVLCSSMASSLFLVTAMNPFDVISTRMYNQKKDPVTKRGLLYSSLFDCIVKTARTEGFRGFYKGILAHYFRIGPHTILMFVFFEQIKSLKSKFF